MRNLLLFIFSTFTAIALKAQTPSIEALRTCAAEKGMSPKEYIFTSWPILVLLSKWDTSIPKLARTT